MHEQFCDLCKMCVYTRSDGKTEDQSFCWKNTAEKSGTHVMLPFLFELALCLYCSDIDTAPASSCTKIRESVMSVLSKYSKIEINFCDCNV